MELADKIKLLTGAQGVSGDELRVSAVVAELLGPLVDTLETTRFGNVIGVRRCGKSGAPRLMLDAHIDQIGFLVTEITDEGFLRFMSIGVDGRMLPGCEVTVLTAAGAIPGVIGLPPFAGKKAAGRLPAVPIEDMCVDIGMTGTEAKAAVRVGDYMLFRGAAFELEGSRLCSGALDDRACLVCILHALELLQGKELCCDIIISASVKEELGGHGSQYVAYSYKPDLAIAVDVSHAKTPDAPNVCCELGKGPIIGIGSNSRPDLAQRLQELAKKQSIPFQLSPVPAHSGTNAWSIQLAGAGVSTLVLSLPLRYMHSPVEVLDMDDVRSTGALLAAFAADVGGERA